MRKEWMNILENIGIDSKYTSKYCSLIPVPLCFYTKKIMRKKFRKLKNYRPNLIDEKLPLGIFSEKCSKLSYETSFHAHLLTDSESKFLRESCWKFYIIYFCLRNFSARVVFSGLILLCVIFFSRNFDIRNVFFFS